MLLLLMWPIVILPSTHYQLLLCTRSIVITISHVNIFTFPSVFTYISAIFIRAFSICGCSCSGTGTFEHNVTSMGEWGAFLALPEGKRSWIHQNCRIRPFFFWLDRLRVLISINCNRRRSSWFWPLLKRTNWVRSPVTNWNVYACISFGSNSHN